MENPVVSFIILLVESELPDFFLKKNANPKTKIIKMENMFIEVQSKFDFEQTVAVLTEEINRLTEHFKEHKHDYHSQRGLMKKVGRRKKLLAYLKGKDLDRYKALIAKLGLRK